MNKSKHIKSENCRICGGLCCKSFSIIYEKGIEKINPSMFSEIQRFKLLDTKGKIEVKEEKEYFEVTFNFPCKHLKRKNKVYFCDIYNSAQRPLLCEEYPYKNTIMKDCPFVI
jgi:Fe-S-cluster containining protein